MAATVVAPRAMDADALATAVLVLGPTEGLGLLAREPGTQGLVVTEGPARAGLEIRSTAGLAERLTLRARVAGAKLGTTFYAADDPHGGSAPARAHDGSAPTP